MRQDTSQKLDSVAPASTLKLERLPAVLARTGLSRTELWRRAGLDFPTPVRLGPASVAWIASEVDLWITDRIAASRVGKVRP